MCIAKWTDASMIYMNIILLKNPSLAIKLLQYCITIWAALRQNSTGWIKYNRLFPHKLAQYLCMVVGGCRAVASHRGQ